MSPREAFFWDAPTEGEREKPQGFNYPTARGEKNAVEVWNNKIVFRLFCLLKSAVGILTASVQLHIWGDNGDDNFKGERRWLITTWNDVFLLFLQPPPRLACDRKIVIILHWSPELELNFVFPASTFKSAPRVVITRRHSFFMAQWKRSDRPSMLASKWNRSRNTCLTGWNGIGLARWCMGWWFYVQLKNGNETRYLVGDDDWNRGSTWAHD